MNQFKEVYILCDEAEYKKSLVKGNLIRDSLLQEGFIHASPKDQLTRVANKHYSHFLKLLVLQIDIGLCHSVVKWEPAAGSLYPHIYGPLNMSSVVKVTLFSKNESNMYGIGPSCL